MEVGVLVARLGRRVAIEVAVLVRVGVGVRLGVAVGEDSGVKVKLGVGSEAGGWVGTSSLSGADPNVGSEFSLTSLLATTKPSPSWRTVMSNRMGAMNQ